MCIYLAHPFSRNALQFQRSSRITDVALSGGATTLNAFINNLGALPDLRRLTVCPSPPREDPSGESYPSIELALEAFLAERSEQWSSATDGLGMVVESLTLRDCSKERLAWVTERVGELRWSDAV